MGDPVSMFGTIAGAIQLTDVALRASRDAYGFLAAIKGAKTDVQDLRRTLRDVEANVRNLRSFLAKFAKSKFALEEYEVLPETVQNTLARFYDDILDLKSMLPPKASPDLAQSVKWAYSKPKVKNLTNRLHECESHLLTALSIVGRQNEISLKQDTQNLMSELRKTKDAMMERHENFQAAISRKAMLINKNAKSQERTLKTIPNRLSTLERLHTKHASSLQAGQDAIASALQSGLANIKSTTTFSAANTHTLVSVVRAVLTSELSPMLEDASAKLLAQNSTLIQQLERGIERISQDMGHAIAEEEDGTSSSQSSSGEEPQTCPHPYTFPGAVTEKGSLVNEPIVHGHPSVSNHQTLSGIPLHTVTSIKRSWMMNWKIGRLQIAIETTNHRRDGSPSCKSQTSVEIHFRPAQNFMGLPGLAISWTDAPNHRGFYNMMPGISVIQIIPIEHPIFKAIACGDIAFIQEELASGRVNLRCETPQGNTLLHIAAIFQKADLCRYLAQCGLSWDTRNRWGISSVCMTIVNIFNSPNAERYIPVLQIMRDRGVDIASSVNEMIAGAPLEYPSSGFLTLDEGALYRTLRYLKLVYHVDVWSLQLSQWIVSWLQPLQQRPKLLEQSLAHGFDPNLRKDDSTYSTLEDALYAVAQTKEDIRMGESIELPLWHCLVLLIKAKADIHYQRPQSFDHASHWTDIITVRDLARSIDVGNEWNLALGECGLDPDDVFRESRQRKKRAFRLYGATRTGIDEQSLDVPSASGLRCRSCRRKVCQRGHWSFGLAGSRTS